MEKAKIIQFRRGRHNFKPRHFLLDVGTKNKEDAEKFVGVEAEWVSESGKKIKGNITSTHGNKGLVRAIFERGLPGQAINKECDIKNQKNKKTDKK